MNYFDRCHFVCEVHECFPNSDCQGTTYWNYMSTSYHHTVNHPHTTISVGRYQDRGQGEKLAALMKSSSSWSQSLLLQGCFLLLCLSPPFPLSLFLSLSLTLSLSLSLLWKPLALACTSKQVHLLYRILRFLMKMLLRKTTIFPLLSFPLPARRGCLKQSL